MYKWAIGEQSKHTLSVLTVDDSAPVYSSFHSLDDSVDADVTGVERSEDPSMLSSMLAKVSPDEERERGGVLAAVCACLIAGLGTGKNGEVAAKLLQRICLSCVGSCHASLLVL